ncbi:hypothetical protein T484DRAFT_1839207 [Baffinella frigidus]|nr:hypothetical protein T484DRAFT_1839207 [Cryptophyta sp. CCMP2293]
MLLLLLLLLLLMMMMMMLLMINDGKMMMMTMMMMLMVMMMLTMLSGGQGDLGGGQTVFQIQGIPERLFGEPGLFPAPYLCLTLFGRTNLVSPGA